jgi:hypothetical protein
MSIFPLTFKDYLRPNSEKVVKILVCTVRLMKSDRMMGNEMIDSFALVSDSKVSQSLS